jgi:hypothetical protein
MATLTDLAIESSVRWLEHGDMPGLEVISFLEGRGKRYTPVSPGYRRSFVTPAAQ